MEFRRLIRFGKSSFVISLPKGWIEKNNLLKGDLVYLKEQNQELLITSQEKEKEKDARKVVITTDGKEIELLKSEIISSYLANYDMIEIKGADLKTKAPEIKTILHDLAGVELLEQSSDRILTKDLLNLKEISIESLVRRIDIILRSMLEDSISLPYEDFHESVSHRDFDVNRLVLLTKRVLRSALLDSQIARSLNLDNLSLLKSWQLVNSLELAADEVKRISRCYKEVKISKQNTSELDKLHTLIKDAYLKIMKVYHTKDLRSAYSFEVESAKRMKTLQSLIKKSTDPNIISFVYHVRSFNGVLRDIGRVIAN